MNRTDVFRTIQRLSEHDFEWDLIVIGGGATGLGCAVDAASRGLQVLLLEARDFSSGTSSRSTKLVHGGVRYLLQGRFSLVREALRERRLMLNNAPHLVKPLSFVVPVRTVWSKWFYWAGLTFYHFLAGSYRLGPTKMLSVAELIQHFPSLRTGEFVGGISYVDAQFDDSRFALALLRTLFACGGLGINYLPVCALLKEDGRLNGVVVKDAFLGHQLTLRAKSVVNAAGVWADDVRMLDEGFHPSWVQVSQGIHLVVGREFYESERALLLPKTSDGRVVFVIPWHGKVLMGTTDTPRSDAPFEPKAFPEEVDFILQTVGQYLNHSPSRRDVLSVFVGLRPLISKGAPSHTKAISREHAIWVSNSGLISVTGGKWTTYRIMAQQVVNEVCLRLGCQERQSLTADLKLHDLAGGEPLQDCFVSREDIERAVYAEMAVTIEDVLARRIRILFLDSQAALGFIPLVRSVLSCQLGYKDTELDQQELAFRRLVAQYQVL